MNKQKPREFYLIENWSEDIWYQGDKINIDDTHVIEKSAYDRLQFDLNLVRETLESQRKINDQAWEKNKKLQEACKVMEDCLNNIYKNYELVAYDLVGGDGAPTGYLPYPADSKFILETLTKAREIMEKK